MTELGKANVTPGKPSVGYRMARIYGLVCAVLVLSLLCAVLLIKYTPLPALLSTEGASSEESKAYTDRLNRLQERITAQEQFIVALQQRLTGEVKEPFVDQTPYPAQGPEVERVERSALVDTLRTSVERANVAIPVRVPLAIRDKTTTTPQEHLLIMPVDGSLSNPFDLTAGHRGIDLVAPEHTAVKAAISGTVIFCDWTLRGGNTIVLRHEDDLVTVYKHNSGLLKREGDHVSAGEAIAIIGNTGLHSDGPHVHFELWRAGEPLDPTPYLSL